MHIVHLMLSFIADYSARHRYGWVRKYPSPHQLLKTARTIETQFNDDKQAWIILEFGDAESMFKVQSNFQKNAESINVILASPTHR